MKINKLDVEGGGEVCKLNVEGDDDQLCCVWVGDVQAGETLPNLCAYVHCHNNEESSDSELFNSHLTELRIIGSGNVLKKIFVDESLVCESPIESHMFDILLSLKKPLPCNYCGENDEERMFSKLTEECFPLCNSCEIKGRGAGLRRKSRKIKPNPAKKMKPKVVNKRRKFGKFL